MILFITLVSLLALLTICTFVVIGIGGITFVFIFGDVLVCLWLIIAIIKHFVKKRR
nr:MAG TPA: hypothetical protein [Caudoviricetes sp.]